MGNFAGSRSRPLIVETITGVVREARLGLIVRPISIHVHLRPGAPPPGVTHDHPALIVSVLD